MQVARYETVEKRLLAVSTGVASFNGPDKLGNNILGITLSNYNLEFLAINQQSRCTLHAKIKKRATWDVKRKTSEIGI